MRLVEIGNNVVQYEKVNIIYLYNYLLTYYFSVIIMVTIEKWRKKIILSTDFNSDSNDNGVSTDSTKFKKLISNICKEHHCQKYNKVCIISLLWNGPPVCYDTFFFYDISFLFSYWFHVK